MRERKPGDSPSGYPRDVFPLRAHHGLTVGAIQRDQARKLTELDTASVQTAGHALSLEDPRDIAGHLLMLAGAVRQSVVAGGGSSHALADSLGAQVLALRLALARSEHDQPHTGGAA